MTFFGTDYDRYQRSVYDAGATALLDARVAAGAPAFDAAVRCYVRRAAWRIATPSMFAAQLQHLPAATAVLRRVRAF
jgi:hypothetical protein